MISKWYINKENNGMILLESETKTQWNLVYLELVFMPKGLSLRLYEFAQFGPSQKKKRYFKSFKGKARTKHFSIVMRMHNVSQVLE